MCGRGSGLWAPLGSPVPGDTAAPVVLLGSFSSLPPPPSNLPVLGALCRQRNRCKGMRYLEGFGTKTPPTPPPPHPPPSFPRAVHTRTAFLTTMRADMGYRSYHTAAEGNLCPGPRSAADAAVCEQLFCSACIAVAPLEGNRGCSACLPARVEPTEPIVRQLTAQGSERWSERDAGVSVGSLPMRSLLLKAKRL